MHPLPGLPMSRRENHQKSKIFRITGKSFASAQPSARWPLKKKGKKKRASPKSISAGALPGSTKKWEQNNQMKPEKMNLTDSLPEGDVACICHQQQAFLQFVEREQRTKKRGESLRKKKKGGHLFSWRDTRGQNHDLPEKGRSARGRGGRRRC